MKVQCPNCGASGRIANSKSLIKGGYARCLKCQTRFFVVIDRRTGGDRRSGNDRRKASYRIEDDFPYLEKGGSERRSWQERRVNGERRANWPKKWSITGGGLISRNV